MKIFGVVVLMFLINTQAQAQVGQGHRGQEQGKMTPEQRVEAQLKKLTDELQLDTKQQEQVKAALQDRAKAADELRVQAAAERRERLNKMRAIHQTFQASMKGILNAEQQTKFEQLQAKRKEQVKEQMHRRGGKGKHVR